MDQENRRARWSIGRSRERARRCWVCSQPGRAVEQLAALDQRLGEGWLAADRLERFVDETVWSEASDYRELLLADYLFLNRRLAEFYGVKAEVEFGHVEPRGLM